MSAIIDKIRDLFLLLSFDERNSVLSELCEIQELSSPEERGVVENGNRLAPLAKGLPTRSEHEINEIFERWAGLRDE